VSVLVPVLLFRLVAVAWAQDMKPEDIYKNVVPSVATLTVEKTDGTTAVGNAFMGPKDGLAVTAWHVVNGAKSVTAKFSDGQEFEVSGLVDKDEKRDVALIKIKVFGRPTLAMNPADPPVGSNCYVIGAPEGLEFSISGGLVAQIQTMGGARCYQFTCAASPGSSGGPLVNAKGEAIGVVSWQLREGQNLNFAVPISYALGLDATLPTQPWPDVKPTPASAGASPGNAAETDSVLADSVVSCLDAATAIEGTLRVIGGPAYATHRNFLGRATGATWKLYTPTYLYECQRDLDSKLHDLAGLTVDGARANLRDGLIKILTSDSDAAQGLAGVIKMVQETPGWTPQAQDGLAKAVAAAQSGADEANAGKAALLDAGKSDDFRSRIPRDDLVRLGLEKDPDYFAIGCFSFHRAPLVFVVVTQGALAYKMGFRDGDAVIKFGDQSPNDLTDLKAAIRANCGKDIVATIIRGGKQTTLKVSVPEDLTAN
jgi:S1-C subfamily serine protease